MATPRRVSDFDLVAVVASEKDPDKTYELKRHRATQEMSCNCTSWAVAPTCDGCEKALSRRHDPGLNATVYFCPRCGIDPAPRSCKHLRGFAAGAGRPAAAVVADAMLAKVRRKARPATTTIQQPTNPEAMPVRAVILFD